MNKVKFKKQDLMDHDLPFGGSDEVDLIQDVIIDTTRWSIWHEIIFKWTDGKYYRADYSEGATEMQDEGPWEYQDEVECVEVFLTEKVLKVYQDVDGKLYRVAENQKGVK